MSAVTTRTSLKSCLNPKHLGSSSSLWCGDSHPPQHVPSLQLLFWAKRCRGDDLCGWKHDVSITSKANETKGWQHHTNSPISHRALLSPLPHRGGSPCTIWHCNLPPAPFNQLRNKRTTVHLITINTHQRAQTDYCFSLHHVAQPFLL